MFSKTGMFYKQVNKQFKSEAVVQLHRWFRLFYNRGSLNDFNNAEGWGSIQATYRLDGKNYPK